MNMLGDVNMGNNTLEKYFSTQVLQQIQYYFSNSTGLNAYTIDAESKVIVTPTGKNELYDICMKKSDIAVSKYNNCKGVIIDQAFRTCRPAFSKCFDGLIEGAVPLVANGNAMGAIIIGPVFIDSLEDSMLRKAAKELRIDENIFFEAAKKVQVMPRSQLEAHADFLFSMLNIYIDMGNRYLMENERNEKLRGYYAKFRKSLTGVRELLNSNSEIISELTNSFDNLNKLANTSAQQLENTNETVKLIQNIALNTRILGFNASIEASRAKESGKGFGVIAQEVRSLADVSKSSAEKIEEIVDNITEISEEMRATILETNETVKTAFDNMNSMTSVLEAMSDIAKELN